MITFTYMDLEMHVNSQRVASAKHRNPTKWTILTNLAKGLTAHSKSAKLTSDNSSKSSALLAQGLSLDQYTCICLTTRDKPGRPGANPIGSRTSLSESATNVFVSRRRMGYDK